MIPRKRLIKERILSSTLLEMLLVLLFLLLAISSIHQKLIQEQKTALESGDKMQPGNIQIDEELYKEVISAFGLDKEKNDKKNKNNENEEVKLKELLTKAKEHKKLKKDKEFEERGGDLYGVAPPPCILPNGKQVLFDIDFAGNKKSNLYLIKVKNIEKDMVLENGLVLEKDKAYVWTPATLRKYGEAIVKSNRQNEDDEICDPNNDVRYSKSAYCYECQYVMSVTNLQNEPEFKSLLSRRNHNVSEETFKKMYKIANDYFYDY